MSLIKYSEIDPLDCDTIEPGLPEGWQSGKADKSILNERGKCLWAAQKQPFENKVKYTEKIIKRAIEKGIKWALSYSAGNDSTCLSVFMTEYMGLKVDHVMSNTRMEDGQTIKTFGERRSELKKLGVSLSQALPEKRPDEVWSEHVPLLTKYDSQLAYRLMNSDSKKTLSHARKMLSEKSSRMVDLFIENNIKVSDKCCDILKKKPLKKWQKKNGVEGAFTGMRGEESMIRRLSYIQHGCLFYSKSKGWMCHPLMVWRKEDVEEFLGSFGRKYRDTRNGCTTCMYGAHLEKGENRLQKLRRENPKMFKKAMDDWGYGHAMKALGIEDSLDIYSLYHGDKDAEDFDQIFQWLF